MKLVFLFIPALRRIALFPIMIFMFCVAPSPALAADDDLFFQMIESDDVVGVQAAIAAGRDVNVPDRTGTTPLQRALLVMRKAARRPKPYFYGDIVIDGDGFKSGPAEAPVFDHGVISALIEAGADVNARSQYYPLPLFLALSLDPQVVKMLLAAGADVNARYGLETPLIFAGILASGFFPKAETRLVRMLVDAGADVNVQNASGWTPLMIWVQKNPEAVKILLDAGADVNAKDGHADMTPLLSAASVGGNPDSAVILKMLLAAGADVNARTNDGASALWCASMYGHYRDVEVLLDAGADVNVRAEGFTPLHMATGLIAMEHENNRGSFRERTERAGDVFALSGATRKPPVDFSAVTKLLIEAGADADARSTGDGASVLGMTMAASADKAQVKEERKFAGKTPLELARMVGNDAVAEYLEEQKRK
ncbi:MAG: ankyrin repeat domain-containing protein [Synergistaceae bacterium]|nr:ankyrin repeat domain-containing protein [Synergistaceae bacterium]